MKFIIITLFTLLFQFFTISQNTGLYGKRTFIEFNTVSYMPIFSWWLTEPDGYSSNGSGNTMTLKKDLFEYGFRLAVGRSGKRNTGVSCEFGYNFTNLSAPEDIYKTYIDSWGYENSTSVSIRHERLDVRTISIMPKIEFTSQGGTLPVGLNHQIGLGFTSSKIKKKDYNYQIYNGSGEFTDEEIAAFPDNFTDYNETYKGMTLLYAFNIRTPISKRLMINYGIRYTLNLRNYFVSKIGTDQKYYSKQDVREDFQRMRISNILSFNLGLTFVI